MIENVLRVTVVIHTVGFHRARPHVVIAQRIDVIRPVPHCHQEIEQPPFLSTDDPCRRGNKMFVAHDQIEDQLTQQERTEMTGIFFVLDEAEGKYASKGDMQAAV